MSSPDGEPSKQQSALTAFEEQYSEWDDVFYFDELVNLDSESISLDILELPINIDHSSQTMKSKGICIQDLLSKENGETYIIEDSKTITLETAKQETSKILLSRLTRKLIKPVLKEKTLEVEAKVVPPFTVYLQENETPFAYSSYDISLYGDSQFVAMYVWPLQRWVYLGHT